MTAPASPSEHSRLIREALDGSEDALDDLFRVVSPRVLGAIRMMLGPQRRQRIESQDVLQVTLMKAFQSIEQFEGAGQRSLYGWLAAIARNEIRDQLDYQGRQKRDVKLRVSLDGNFRELQARVLTEVSRIQLQERELKLHEAMDALSEIHRDAILLRDFEELSFPEMGQRLERTPDACRMLYVRAMTALVKELRDVDL